MPRCFIASGGSGASIQIIKHAAFIHRFQAGAQKLTVFVKLDNKRTEIMQRFRFLSCLLLDVVFSVAVPVEYIRRTTSPFKAGTLSAVILAAQLPDLQD